MDSLTWGDTNVHLCQLLRRTNDQEFGPSACRLASMSEYLLCNAVSILSRAMVWFVLSQAEGKVDLTIVCVIMDIWWSLIISNNLLVYIVNSRGPKQEPCGTPHSRSKLLESVPLTNIC